jgi:hypothetical protein
MAPGWATAAVVTVIDHPPAIDPTSPSASSNANSRHWPLGLVPLKTLSAVAADGAGAGAGKLSGPLESRRLVAWNVPVVTAPAAGI